MIKVHFLNVGHGDCIIVEFIDTERVAVIDINRSAELDEKSKSELEEELLKDVDIYTRIQYNSNRITLSELAEAAGVKHQLEDPIDYLDSIKVNNIFRFISTHPHMDHISGLAALNEKKSISNFWIIKNKFKQDLTKLSGDQKKDWALYKKYRDTSENEIDGITVVRPDEGSQRQYWNEDGIYILAPNADLIKKSHDSNNQNIMSYVIVIVYGKNKIVLGGDAEEDTWKHITETYPEFIKNVTILKASHHGRDSGYYQPAVKLMNPNFTIVSVGKKPKTDASSKYSNYSKNVFSTRWRGTIRFELNLDGSGKYFEQFPKEEIKK